jgi:hypothetical protein
VAPLEQSAPIQGSSLAPLFEDGGLWNRSTVFSERRVQLDLPNKNSNEAGIRHSLQTLTRKYMLVSEGPDEYYNLVDDPYEQSDLIEEADIEARRLRDLLVTLGQALTGTLEAETASEAELETLRALGYIQ